MNLTSILGSFLPGSGTRALQSLLTRTTAALVPPPAPRRSIWLDDVPDWSELYIPTPQDGENPKPDPGIVRGWQYSGSNYSQLYAGIPALPRIVEKTERLHTFDIRLVEGLGSAREDLSGFHSLDEWAKVNAPDLIADVNHQALERLLALPEIRINKGDGRDYLVRHDHDGRYFLANDGGAREFAAARYIAGQLECPVGMVAKVVEHKLFMPQLNLLGQQYGIFAIRRDAAFTNTLHNALEKSRATYFMQTMDQGRSRRFGDYAAIILPRDNAGARQAIDAFDAAGAMEVVQHLKDCCVAAADEDYARPQGPRP